MIILRYLILGYIVAIGFVIIGSWVPMEPDSGPHKVWVFCRRITDPVLEPVRRVVPPVGGMLDLSPTIVLFVLFALLTPTNVEVSAEERRRLHDRGYDS